ncbi:MAG: hypothetical protein JWM99_3433 [Verrucomicrobiales bacterium]|jgi:hypothetical protein|nr:hypothetical protein [Verrucomicrobiales bacterium]
MTWEFRSVIFLLSLCCSGISGRAEDEATRLERLLPDKTDAAIAHGVNYLISRQSKEGLFQDPERGPNNSAALTALSMLAFCSVGHMPADATREGDSVRYALTFILREERQEADGYFGRKDGSRMSGHGIITLALSELTGMAASREQDRTLRERCSKAIALIIRSQATPKSDPKFIGGWRNEPESADADLSVTVWQLQALLSARKSGYAVPQASLDLAFAYIKRSYKSERNPAGVALNLKSACAYQPGGDPEFVTAASGLLSLQLGGFMESPEAIGSREWLRTQKPTYESNWFIYGNYCYVQAFASRAGEIDRQAYLFTESSLLPHQSPDGSWLAANAQERDAGRIYGTAMAILNLSAKFHYLPVFR